MAFPETTEEVSAILAICHAQGVPVTPWAAGTSLEGHALFDRIKRPVVLNADQTPQYSDIRLAGHEGGEFIFVRHAFQ